MFCIVDANILQTNLKIESIGIITGAKSSTKPKVPKNIEDKMFPP